jgi:hypothetical protein
MCEFAFDGEFDVFGFDVFGSSGGMFGVELGVGKDVEDVAWEGFKMDGWEM